MSETVADFYGWGSPHASSSGDTCQLAASIEALAADWLRLSRRATNTTVFQTYSWCSSWLAAAAKVGRPERPFVVVVRRGGEPVLIWPLCRRLLAGCRILHALGDPATQYCDALVDPACDRPAALNLAWQAVLTRGRADLLHLRRVRDDAAIAALEPIGSIPADDAAPFIEIAHAATAPYHKGRRRNKLRERMAKLAKHGEITFEVLNDPAEKVRAVEQAIAFKRDWMRERALWSGGYTHPAATAFTPFIAQDPGFVVLSLKAGTTPVAIEAGYVMRGTFWSLVKTYDIDFAELTPGHLIMLHELDYCAAQRLDRLDFLAPSQRYKKEWSTGAVGVRDAIVPLTWRGKVFAHAARIALPTAKRILGHLVSRQAPQTAAM
jgi:CelD/BcsL family acetyltransferase involved in cellulose biosynthesis